MSNANPYAAIVVPTFLTTFEGDDISEEAFEANLSVAFAGIIAAFESTPKGRDCSAYLMIPKLIEMARNLDL